jgi:hypothetical protein
VSFWERKRHGSNWRWEVQSFEYLALPIPYSEPSVAVLNPAGCRTCRRRRVKCDERPPTCERCEKGGMECEGYAREHRFVDEVARTVRHVQRALVKQKSTSRSTSRDLIPSSSESQSLPPEMSVIGFQENTFISFLLSNLFGAWQPSQRHSCERKLKIHNH